MKITPRGSTVLLKPSDGESKLGGFVLPDTKKKERPNEGTVVAVGDSVRDLKEGDNVIFNPYAPEEYIMDEKPVYLIEEKDILATFSE